MKVLTIKQPFASLIINGHKKYEFRSWKTNYRGKIFIHAGLGIDKENIIRFDKYNLDYIYGAIIGEAYIVDCKEVDILFKEQILLENKEVYKNGSGFAFVLENVIKYEKPIPYKGQLGLWNIDIQKEDFN